MLKSITIRLQTILIKILIMFFFLKADTINIVVNLNILIKKNGIKNDSFIIKFFK